jgi:hypothetical protein
MEDFLRDLCVSAVSFDILWFINFYPPMTQGIP